MKRNKIERETKEKVKEEKEEEEAETFEIFGEQAWIMIMCAILAVTLFICVVAVCINEKRQKRLSPDGVQKKGPKINKVNISGTEMNIIDSSSFSSEPNNEDSEVA